jgi:hypothetical protein
MSLASCACNFYFIWFWEFFYSLNAANNGWTKEARIFAPAKIATLLDIQVDLPC